MTMMTHLLMIFSVLVMLMLSASSTLANAESQDGNTNGFSAKNFRSCNSRSTPPRGTYVAISRPCEFIFYKTKVFAHDDSSSSSAAEDDGILSDVCFADSHSEVVTRQVLSTREEYAVLWPDECTGDFIRCYNIEGTSDYASAYGGGSINTTLALQQVMNWTVPEGATQLSVNCTADRAVTEMTIDAFADGVEQGLEGFMLIAKAIFYLTIASIGWCVYCCVKPCLFPPRNRPYRNPTSAPTSYEMVDQNHRSIPMAKGVPI